MHQRFATDGVVVGDGFFAGGSVDNHGHVAVDRCDQRYTGDSGDFVDAFAGDAARFEMGDRATTRATLPPFPD